MKSISPMFVTVTMLPRKGVENAPGALAGAVCTTVSFQKGLLVLTSAVMRLVLLMAVKVRGRPLGELAVTGMISDLPAGMEAFGIRSITGAARAVEPMKRADANEKNRNFI